MKRPRKAAQRRPEIIVGIDAEWVNAARAEIEGGTARDNAVISYQAYVLDPTTGRAHSAIVYTSGPTKRHRLNLATLLGKALRGAIAAGVINAMPNMATVVAHFARADLTALRDWPVLKKQVDGVRKTVASVKTPLLREIRLSENGDAARKVMIAVADTMLLAPAGSSLAKLGDVIGVPKIELPKGAIERMDLLRADDPELFERYAMRDAEVAALYYASVRRTLSEKFRVKKPVPTLSGAGVQMIMATIAGLGVSDEKFFGRRMVHGEPVTLDECASLWPFAANCYHGGRNEAFWLGPSRPGTLFDLDLKAAYTTAMACIQIPQWSSDWREVRLERLAVTDEALTFARVRFSFPAGTRFPCLPVRAGDHGLIYPMGGVSWCTGPELVVALDMGAEIIVEEGARIEWQEGSPRPFEAVTRRVGAIRKAAKASGDELLNMTAKEIGNSAYGKLAQGVKSMRSQRDGKRCFDTRSGVTMTLPASKVTCPPLAAFVTGMVRAALSEALARLPSDATLYSATTDGFLSDVGVGGVDVTGRVAQAMSQARQRIDGDPTIWEQKHRVAAVIVTKTRGAITTARCADEGAPVLARAGFRLEERYEDDWRECLHWAAIYAARDYDTRKMSKSLTSLRDQWEKEADLVEETRLVRLNLDTDLKRALDNPENCGGLLRADTRPWPTVDDFKEAREALEEWRKSKRRVLKSLEDYQDMQAWRADRAGRRAAGGTSQSSRPPLVDAFLRAAARGQFGVSLSQKEIADIVTASGHPCTLQTVKDAKRRGGLKMGEIHRLSAAEEAFLQAVQTAAAGHRN